MLIYYPSETFSLLPYEATTGLKFDISLNIQDGACDDAKRLCNKMLLKLST